MALGPIEVLVVGFPGNEFNGEILPELERLVESDVIHVVDGLFVCKDGDGTVTFAEFGELAGNSDAERMARAMEQLESLVSDDDVDEIAEALDPDTSAAVLVLEHTWAKPLQDAVADSGGVLITNFRVPKLVVDELLAELAAAE